MRALAPLACIFVLAGGLSAQQETVTGPLVPSYGPVFQVDPDIATPLDIDYKVAFDLAQGGQTERPSQSIGTVARFMNMHAQAGVPHDRIGAAIVVHGSAVLDVLHADAYHQRQQAENPNAGLIRELLEAGVQVIVCGQSATARGVAKEDLMDGVDMALSAMTAFVILQSRGFVVNPW